MGGVRRELVVLRHAKSAWPPGVPDFRRPLAERGRRDAPVAGRWLREHVPGLELVVCSSAKRTRQTWELVAPELRCGPRVAFDDRLYAASVRDLVEVARELPAEVASVLFIAHNPGLEDLVYTAADAPCTLKTSAIAVLSGSSDWTEIGPGWAELVVTANPRG
ncbi:MAG: SixA phosphatase family protein [Haloechinothrix sp.]